MPFEGTVLALDISGRATGIAEGRPGETPRFETQRFAQANDEYETIAGRAVLWAAQRFMVSTPGIVYCEAPIQNLVQYGKDEETGERVVMGSNARSKIILIGVWFAIAGVCEARGIPVRRAAVSTIRKAFIGRGNHKGDTAKRLCRDRCHELGWNPPNLDCADAGALWYYACSQLAPEKTPIVKPLFLRGAA